MARTLRSVFAPVLLAGVVAIPTNPNNYSIELKATAHLRAPQRVALRNAYEADSAAQIKLRGTTLVVDRRQLTETAIEMLTRALEKQGITVAPDAEKTITLRVAPTGVTAALFRWTGRIVLEARLGDGKLAHIPQESLSPKGWENAFDGAVLFALNDLLEHENFVAYMNR